MPDNVCKVQCKAVDEKLESVWKGIKERVVWTVFWPVISGIGLIALFFLAMIFSNQSSMATTLNKIQSDVMVIQAEMKHLNNKSKNDSP